MIRFTTGFRAKRNHRPGIIYLVQRKPDNLIKIGLTENIKRRLKELERTYGYLVLVHMIETTDILWTEQWLHKCLESCRIEGEWFDLPEEARRLLFALEHIDPPDDEPEYCDA